MIVIMIMLGYGLRGNVICSTSIRKFIQANCILEVYRKFIECSKIIVLKYTDNGPFY